jgi:hypothetical protein
VQRRVLARHPPGRSARAACCRQRPVLTLLRAWRERGWTPIDAASYAQAWQQYGGSVATHPLVVERLAGLAAIPVRYLGWFAGDRVLAAIPCWGPYLALSKEVLKKRGQRGLFDLGNAESHPADRCRGLCTGTPAHAIRLRAERRTHQHAAAAAAGPGAGAPTRGDSARSSATTSAANCVCSKKRAGSIRSMLDFSPSEQAAIYADLFERRWGFAARGAAHLSEVFRCCANS